MLLALQSWIQNLSLPNLLVIGIMVLLAFYAGRGIKHLRLPTIIGFMLAGALLGPSLLNVICKDLQLQLDFITRIALGSVALSIGLELKLQSVWQKGAGILLLTAFQLILTFLLVGSGLYLLTGNLALALPMAAIATTTGPIGTMEVIQDTRARGPLCRTLYTILGFDNALAIVLFGFAIAIARNLLGPQTGEIIDNPLFIAVLSPLIEAASSLALGAGLGIVFCLFLRLQKDQRGILIQTVAMILIVVGLCEVFNLSFILALLVTGSVVVNTQPAGLLERLRNELTGFMPLLYVLFFALAGAKLQVSALPQIGFLGLVYIFCRTVGKIGGAYIGATRRGPDENLKPYTGMALLSQSGVAIGLALIVSNEFNHYGPEGARIGAVILTTITACCILFELIGPILAEKALRKAGEIQNPL